jgi:uncharacterized protein YndB with AHSA1/START domain
LCRVEAAGSIDTDVFILTWDIDAPRELVWQAWTECEHLMHWWGPVGFTMRQCTIDVRPGGLFHYRMTGPAGQEMWGRWVIREATRQERLVFVNSFSDEQANVVPVPFEEDWPAEILSTVTFSDHGGGTRLEMHGIAINASEVQLKTFANNFESMRVGWGGSLDQLVGHLAEA